MKKSIPHHHYVYTLAYPEGMGVVAGTAFYVGKSSERKISRLEEHLMEARAGVQSYKCDCIRSILAAGKEVLFTIVARFVTEREAFAYEKILIHAYGDTLSNITHARRRRKTYYPRPLDFLRFFERECGRTNHSLEIIARMSGTLRIVIVDALRGTMQPDCGLVLKWISLMECSEESARYILDGFGYPDQPVERVPVETYLQWRRRKQMERLEKAKQRKQRSEQTG